MAPAALPLAKLGSLLIKTLAKPVAKNIKNSMTKRPLTRSALISVGQTTHAMTTRMTIWSAGYKIRSITPLEDEAALSRGADILSESFIFVVSGAILVYEYNRSSEKERKKEEARLQKIRDEATQLQAQLTSLETRLVALEGYAKANQNSLIFGIGVGSNVENVEPDSVVPINEGGESSDVTEEVTSEKISSETNRSEQIKQSNNLIENSQITERGTTGTTRRWGWWFWPIR